MMLTATELAHVRSQGLSIYITEKCDACGKLLNQTIRYTIADKPEVYCSAPVETWCCLATAGRPRSTPRRASVRTAAAASKGRSAAQSSVMMCAEKRILEKCNVLRRQESENRGHRHNRINKLQA